MIDQRYQADGIEQVLSPSLVIFRDLVDENLKRMITIAGSPERLRPHCKTHKMPAAVEIELAAGIARHKCATIAEAEMLADSGVRDITLAYQMVGPNIQRAVEFRSKYPSVKFGVIVDHPLPVKQLSEAVSAAGVDIDVLLDIDTGQHRTGISVGPEAQDLYELIHLSPGLHAAGFHVYDGHQHQTIFEERRAAVLAEFNKVLDFRRLLRDKNIPVPTIICGGTGSFPVYAGVDDPDIELSPGTCIFHDQGYTDLFPDLKFIPAALLLTRVVSRPTTNRITFDLGYKAVASDPPAGRRLVLPEIPDADMVLQNEEHLVVETSVADRYQPGDYTWAIPRHICPTTALHKVVTVVQNGRVVDTWDVPARDRQLTI